MFATVPDAFNSAIAEPEWVASWLAKRGEAAERTQAKRQAGVEAATETTPEGARERARRAGRRDERVLGGIEGLQRWLHDLARNGLAGLESRGASFWEAQAARLVDAQAPGLARRVRELGEIPGSRRDWPARLLAGLGRLELLIHAYRRGDKLSPELASDVRHLIGFNAREEDVLARGQVVRDRWTVIGQWIEEDEKVRAQRSWLAGEETGRFALFLQFSFGGAPFERALAPGTRIEAELAFWPGAFPLRALIKNVDETARAESFPLAGDVEALHARYADALARQPWVERFPAVLKGVVPVPGGADERWRLVDRVERSLPLSKGEHWRLLAVSGGQPVDVGGEWDGEALLPLGAMSDGRFEAIWEGPA